MIFDGTTLPLPFKLKADVCVIGSGAGGAMLAMVAAEAGLSVVVLETGPYVPASAMNQREETMLPLLFLDSGVRTTKNRAVKILQGRGVGGSTLHNLNLCKRIPDEVFAAWARDGSASLGELRTVYDEVEELLSVSEVPEGLFNRANQLLRDATRSLGWAGGALRHNRTGCVGSGFCELGCAYDAKNNALKVLVPRAVARGTDIVTNTSAVTILHARRRVQGVLAVVRRSDGTPMGNVEVVAPRVAVCASATHTPALLRRSRISDPSRTTGKTLHLHPALVVAGKFAEPIHAWRGIPQTFECTEWLDFSPDSKKRVWIVPAFAHPVATATLAPGHGAAHARFMSEYPHLVVLSAMVHDETKGTVEPDGDHGVAIDYWPEQSDSAQLGLGAWAAAKLLFQAGAHRVVVPREPPLVFERGDSFEALRTLPIEVGPLPLTSTHPMGSVPVSDDPKRGALDGNGRHHYVEGLWVADASVFPSSIGVPPQLSTYAFGLRAGRALVKAG